MIRFHDSWLEEPALRDWLVKVTNDESRAYCRWCAIVLRAHKADLTTHASTVKHAKNAESASLAGVNSGPMSVQIVPSDEQAMSNVINPQNRTPYSDLSFGAYQRATYSPKRFRPEWQEIDELKGWLEPCQEDPARAYCKVCEVPLRAHKHDLLLHGRSTKHKRCCQVTSSAVPTTSANANVMPVEYETTVPHSELVTSEIVGTMVTSVGDEEPMPKRSRLEEVTSGENMIQTISTDEGDTTTVIIPDEGRNGTQEEINGTVVNSEMKLESEEEHSNDRQPTQISIIRVVDKPKNPVVYSSDNFRPTPLSSLRRRRGRLNAADVVRAIELNEFTGYEMLQILKSIVPKL